LKKIISCPGEKVEYCGGSNMCDVPNGTDQACCVPFRSNLQRWCSNKPLYSSYCLKDRDENQIVLCSQTPQILDCPEGSTRCLQDLSIKARCA
jgi:hypothetical protein